MDESGCIYERSDAKIFSVDFLQRYPKAWTKVLLKSMAYMQVHVAIVTQKQKLVSHMVTSIILLFSRLHKMFLVTSSLVSNYGNFV